jgi:uncharacterized protein
VVEGSYPGWYPSSPGGGDTGPRELKPPPPTDVWADNRVVLRRSSIEGTGLFACDDIEAETVVLRLGGRLVTSADLAVLIAAADADPATPYVDTITVYEDAHLVMPSNSVIHFGNHSCDPTLWHAGPYELAARRDVRAGEELIVDYGTNSGTDGFVMECHCGSADCRGRVTSDDWSDPGLRVRYEGHWTPALQRRIDRS